MSAQIIHLNESTRLRMRIKRATKVRPLYTTERATEILRELARETPTKHVNLIRADAEQAIQELERNGDLPEMHISFGASTEWRNCSKCFEQIRPSQDCALDHKEGWVWCMMCWRRGG